MRIILGEAIRNGIGGRGNRFMGVLKERCVGFRIGVGEMFGEGKMIG